MTKIPSSKLSRRTVFAGAGAVGAMATAAALLPRQAATPVAAAPQPEPDAQSGYQVTQHVLRYYQTAKV